MKNKVIKLGVSGASGRMGSAIIRLAIEDSDFSLVRAMERSRHPMIGQAIPGTPGMDNKLSVRIDEDDESLFKGIDVLVEFTEPQTTLKHVEYASKVSCAVVIGTTGFKPSEMKKIRGASKKIPILISPNMSVGANLLFQLGAEAARGLGERYDMEVIEAHHRHKKDAPSGTALKLAEGMASSKGWSLEKCAVYGRKGITGKRNDKEIGIHAIRAGETIGLHTALFSGPGETIEITHRASSRDAFAGGALEAAKFIFRRKKGLYQMKDFLKAAKG